jgi:hypothetical protein
MEVVGRAEVAVKVHATQPSLQATHFLIANLELEFPVSHSKQRMETLSNRKFFAILKSKI